MPRTTRTTFEYFDLSLQTSAAAWRRYRFEEGLLPFRHAPLTMRLRVVADTVNRRHGAAITSAGELNLTALLTRVFRHLIERHFQAHACRIEGDRLLLAGEEIAEPRLVPMLEGFVEFFPPVAVRDGHLSAEKFLKGPAGAENRLATLNELFILAVQNANPAVHRVRELFDDGDLARRTSYRQTLADIDRGLEQQAIGGALGRSLLALLEEPIKAAPDSLQEQLRFVRTRWSEYLPPDLQNEIVTAFDIVAEETRMRGFGPGPTRVIDFRQYQPDYHYPEPEAFTADADWMSNVVLIAKSTYVWLDQLSKRYQRPIVRVDQIPDQELDKLARAGFNSLWLIGIWERSSVSQWIKHMRGNPEALASAYSLYDYIIAHDLGGEEAMAELERRCWQRGIRLASDIVPNHTGLYSRWLKEHPDWYVQLDYPPYPSYRFTGRDLSPDPELTIQIEDGYYDHSEAAVVFKLSDHRDGRVRYVYHGNDGTHMPWNDTAQLNYLIPEVREAMVQTILHIARRFKVIRFDAAMTLAKKHFQRLWFPQPGGGAGVPSRAEHAMTRDDFERAFPKEFWREVVDRVAAEVPDTLLIAEAFWLMEGYFVRTLGMHRVYNSAFMNMLKNEENAKYRLTIKNTLEFNHEILKRFTNFMNNPDEATAVEQFGKGEKYYGVATMLATMPGLPMFGHGQVEGLSEKYGMEYSKAYWDEEVDEGMVREHERRIFPLLRKRYLFSGSQNFRLYDFWGEHGVDEDVFAYSNRCGHERALVVYHNKYAETRGWIRTSAAWAVDPSGNPAWLEQTTLGHAFELKNEEAILYRFREHNSGGQYLRTGRELTEQGLYVELHAYQSQVFLDFRELPASDGAWLQIYRELAGRPAPDLDRLWGRRHYAELIAKTRELTAPATLTALYRKLTDKPIKIKANKEFIDFEQKINYFWTSIIENLSLIGSCAELQRGFAADLAAFERLAGLSGRSKKAQEALSWLRGSLLEPEAAPKTAAAKPKTPTAAAKPEDKAADASLALGGEKGQTQRILLPWLLWHRLQPGADSPDPQASPAHLATRCLFDETLCVNLQAGDSPPFDLTPERAQAEIRLLMLMLEQPPVAAAQELPARLAAFLQNPAGRDYLECNVHQGIEWFNRERFENLVHWSCLLGAFGLSLGEEKNQALLEGIVALHEQGRQLIAKALTIGYQIQPMARHLKEVSRETTRAG